MTLTAAWNLTGLTALVTGAGSATGIGFATARSLGELGATVAITGTTARIHDRARELVELGINARGFVARLESAALASELGEALAAASVIPNILVNNAGMVASGDAEMLSGDARMDPEDWDRSISLNLSSAFYVTRLVIAPMRAARWGRIVTVASVTGPVMASRGDVSYAAAKAGLTGFTRAVAVDEAVSGITANAVAPGWINTGSQLPAEALEGEHVPARRSGTADEVASAIVWLATPGASYVTGQTIVVDGGNSVGEQRLRTP